MLISNGTYQEHSPKIGQKVDPADFDDNLSLNNLEEEDTSLNLLRKFAMQEKPYHGDDFSSCKDELPTLSHVASLIGGGGNQECWSIRSVCWRFPSSTKFFKGTYL
ncbi:hypothetical protein AABB24_020353 [Solanum stoloniferum]